VIHIILFAGFLILSVRSITLIFIGIKDGWVFPGFGGAFGDIYSILKDLAGTAVLIACIVAAVRRGLFQPERYQVPAKYGKAHTAEAFIVLGLIATLVTADMFFEGSLAAAHMRQGVDMPPLLPGTGPWLVAHLMAATSLASLQITHWVAYYVHELAFFTFLCFLPMGKHFHVITSLFNVFFMKLKKGSVKPVRWGVADEKLDDLDSFGVKTYEDFTWKHMLDFYSCADCGRCSDNCPANAVGRPLSPRFISIKCRDYAFTHYPLRGSFYNGRPLMGNILEEDEIWSCTTCGACEEECPLMIEYIDKIVDLRRGMVDEGMVPQSLQKPLQALEKRGNPYGKMERKRAEWTKTASNGRIKMLDKGESAYTLFFVDSITSYDDRIQLIGQATARVMSAVGVDFGILGKLEKDSGHEVRRFGEEMLFQQLRDQNIEAIQDAGVRKIVTADPHAYNAFTKDYGELPPVEHISQLIWRHIEAGKLTLKPVESELSKVYTYHDPCYLGRHNGLYEQPRKVIDSIPGLQRIEMGRHCRDRSFCCGGGGLMLFYEPIEDKRMGQVRVEMAKEAGANVIVTACPYCMVNIEDAIKTSGLEGKMEVVDLVELVDRQLDH
jgi:Fe-S oxidoreductase